ncbi:MAG: HIT domain-containing protein [Candidatus Levybacteria bacterium]|nr:HIT domain-containing protein [Candidatus Levybacteria bacterium]
MKNCIFCKIAKGEIPKKFGYQDKDIMVFDDINPLAPIHILIVPKKHIKDFNNMDDSRIWNKMRGVAQVMVAKKGIKNKGYRVVINGGGAQIIDHLHLHITGPLGKSAKM